jgi:hypothetical protein
MPIETAPRDGTPILLCLKGVIGIGFVRAHRFDDLDLLDAPAAWVGTKQWESRPTVWMGGHDACEADHWMPLPEPPE